MADLLGMTDHPAHSAGPKTMADLLGTKPAQAAPAARRPVAAVSTPPPNPGSDPAYMAAVNQALSRGIASAPQLAAIGQQAVGSRQQATTRARGIKAGPLPKLSTGPTRVQQLAPLQSDVGGGHPFAQGGAPFSTALSALGTALNAPESLATHLGAAGADLLRGNVGAAGHEALSGLTHPNDTVSSVLAAHGVKLPTGAGVAADILGNPLNLVGFSGAAGSLAGDAARVAEAAHGAELGATGGKDALTMLAEHMHPDPVTGEVGPAPQLPEVGGSAEYLQPHQARLTKAQERLTGLQAERDAALARRATVRQGVRAGARQERTAARLRTTREARPGMLTRQLRRAGQSAERAQKAADDLVARQPLAPGRSVGMGKRLKVAEQKVAKATRELDTAMRRSARMGGGGFSEYGTIIDQSAVVGDAREKALLVARRGVRMRIGTRRVGKGFDLATVSPETAGKIVPARLGQDARKLFVSRYAGRPHEGAAMAIGARDQIISHARANFSKELRAEARAAGILHDPEARQAATFHAEGTTPTEHPGAQRIADYARNLMERNYQRSETAGIPTPYREQYMPIRWKDRELRRGVKGPSGKRARLPGEQAHERLREHPHVAAAVATHGADAIETDALRLLMQRQSEQVMAEANAELQRTLVRRFGIAAGKYDPAKIPEGYRLARDLNMKYVNPESLIRDDAAETYSQLLEGGKRIDDLSRLAPVRLARAWARMKLLTPGFDVRNTRDEALLAAQAGVEPITAAIRGVRMLRGKGMVGGRSALSAQQARYLAETVGGVTQSGLATVETEGARGLGRLGPKGAWAQEKLHGARVARENAQRLGTYATMLRRGQTPREAMRLTEQIHLPYHDPGLFVENMRRSGLGSPFFTWLGRNIPRQLTLAAQRPGQLAAYNQLQRHSQGLAGGPSDILAPWVQQEGAFGLPGGGFASMRTPQSDLATMLPLPGSSGFSQALGNDVSSLAPFVQAGLAGIGGLAGHPIDMGKYLATGSMPSANQNVGGIEAALLAPTGVEGHGSMIGPQGKDVATTTVPRAIGQLYSFLDPTALGSLSNIVSSAQGTSPHSVPASIMHLLTNEQTYPANSPSDWQYSLIGKQQAVKAAQKDLTTSFYAARLQPPAVAQQILASKQAAVQQAAQDLMAFVDRMRTAGAAPSG